MPVRIISYNLNGIRAAINKGWFDWIKANNFDIIGVQETKADRSQVDTTPLLEMGYGHQHWFSADKKGYSGVAIFSKREPDRVETGIGNAFFDGEGRVIRADYGDFTLVNCYFPSGTSGEERQQAKYDFLELIYPWVEQLRQSRPNILLQGDYNIAHAPIDLHNPKGNQKTSGFLPDERAWMDKWFSQAGFVDTFRLKNPDTPKYSWWNVRSGARATNKGWRIDYQSVTPSLAGKVLDAQLLNDAVHSDHCPCLVELDI